MDISLASFYSNLRSRCFIVRVICTYKATLSSLFLDGYIGAIVSSRILRERKRTCSCGSQKSTSAIFYYIFLTAYYTICLWRSFLPPHRSQGLNSKSSGLTAGAITLLVLLLFRCLHVCYVYVLRNQRTTCKSYARWVPGIELGSYRQEPLPKKLSCQLFYFNF